MPFILHFIFLGYLHGLAISKDLEKSGQESASLHESVYTFAIVYGKFDIYLRVSERQFAKLPNII